MSKRYALFLPTATGWRLHGLHSADSLYDVNWDNVPDWIILDMDEDILFRYF